MWQVILGALSALGGAALTQYWQGRREVSGRFYDQRRDAHMEYLKIFDGYWSSAVRYSSYQEGPPPSDLDPDDFDGLFNALLVVQIFASTASHRAAQNAKDQLLAFYRTNGKGDQSKLQATFDAYIGAVRKELGVR
ncbi:hypothetical protein [Nonomuraea endophytica]|uniref:hypothetical protein n=1 Tax=Nonomuraea endophytica TaxID=714136 RepID=UPI0037C8BFFC